jgi:maltose/maltodextrin transport system substrate-binding protein
MIKKLLCGFFFGLCVSPAFAWTDGELLIWISGNRAYHALGDLGKSFEKDIGARVKIETQEQITDKYQAAAQSGKGPDIFFWAHDRIEEWADAGLIKPLEIKDDFKAAFLPMAWDAVTHNKQIWGYPLSLEAVSLIYNKQLVSHRQTAHPALRDSRVQQGAQREESEADRNHVGLQHSLFQLTIPGQRRSLLFQEN